MPTDLCRATATELLHLYHSHQASPVDATRSVLARIERDNPRINAFRMFDSEAALAAARASEARWLANAPCGLLDGVPVSIKDLILTRGWSTLRGSRTVDPNQPWEVDAPATARLREAGAVLLGKTTTPEFGCKGATDSFLTGVSRNPWKLSATPGGSSGGSAAAVAAGMGPLALGTDGAGSVRIPSSFCGVVGHKASFGRVPAWPPSPFASVSHVGPHARSVEDAALMLTVIAAPDVRDWYSLPFEPRDYRVGLNAGVAGLRIAFSPRLGYAKVHAEVAQGVAHAARLLADLGAHVEEVDPGFADPVDLICGIWYLGAATLVSMLNAEQRKLIDPMLAWQAEQGERITAIEANRVSMRRAELGMHMRRFHERFDLLVTPGVAVPAFDTRETGGRMPIHTADFLGWTPFSYPFNLTLQPATVLPCGLTAGGLPIAIQLVGAMHDDALVLRAARALEGALAPMPEAALAA